MYKYYVSSYGFTSADHFVASGKTSDFDIIKEVINKSHFRLSDDLLHDIKKMGSYNYSAEARGGSCCIIIESVNSIPFRPSGENEVESAYNWFWS